MLRYPTHLGKLYAWGISTFHPARISQFLSCILFAHSAYSFGGVSQRVGVAWVVAARVVVSRWRHFPVRVDTFHLLPTLFLSLFVPLT